MIHCRCGEPLLDGAAADTVTVAGQDIPFRRTTDYVACVACGALIPSRSLRAAAASGEERPDDSLPAEADAGGAGTQAGHEAPRADDDVDVVLSALRDLAGEDADLS